MKTDEKILERNFKALANKRRLAILKALKNRRRASVGLIAEDIRLSFKATSKHLNILYAAGIVEKEQESLTVYYNLSNKILEPVRSALTLL